MGKIISYSTLRDISSLNNVYVVGNMKTLELFTFMTRNLSLNTFYFGAIQIRCNVISSDTGASTITVRS